MWLSLLLAAAAVPIMFLGQMLEVGKKILKPDKSRLEITKLKQEAKAEQRAEDAEGHLVKLATLEDVDKYVVSFKERQIRVRYELETEKERLSPKPFIADEREKR